MEQRLTVDIPTCAEILGISRGTAYSLAAEDKLPVKVIRLGPKRVVVSRAALERNLEQAGQVSVID